MAPAFSLPWSWGAHAGGVAHPEPLGAASDVPATWLTDQERGRHGKVGATPSLRGRDQVPHRQWNPIRDQQCHSPMWRVLDEHHIAR